MNLLNKNTMFIITVMMLSACGGGGSTTTNPNETKLDKNITISSNTQVRIESLGIANTIDAKIDLGSTPKDVYVLLSNYATSSGNVKITKSNKNVATIPPASNKLISSKATRIHAPAHVEAFRKNIHKYLHKNTQKSPKLKVIETSAFKKDVALDTQKFYLDVEQVSDTNATARKIVSNISTIFGDKTLNIWVSDDSFGSGCGKQRCVTQEMVDALADTFLKKGSDNDIYDWVTNIYGEEWGATNDDSFITPNDEITILLTDISNDNSITGGVLGYYHSKDNIKKSVLSGSNERVMLYMDAVLFANAEDAWSIDDYWPKEMISTLAHEFQHMIHFYQKTIRLVENGEQSDTWINEMLAETTEDLVATKIKHTGPRGIVHTDGSAGESGNSEGRYPLFNANNRLSLTAWSGSIANYSNVNAFGAFLIRNYGGAKVLHDIMHNAYIDEQAVVTAVQKAPNGTDKTFNDLLKEWGIAVLLSDNDNLDAKLPAYNTGEFTLDTYGNSTYEIGSVNFFNYDPSPKISGTSGTVEKQGNYYHKIGSDLSGNIEIDLILNGQTEATLIVK